MLASPLGDSAPEEPLGTSARPKEPRRAEPERGLSVEAGAVAARQGVLPRAAAAASPAGRCGAGDSAERAAGGSASRPMAKQSAAESA